MAPWEGMQAGHGLHEVREPSVSEGRFVVAGDGGQRAVERCAAQTVRWAARLLQQDFFAKAPDRVLEIWLFDGPTSYRKHARELFGDTPTSSYGYYSPAHGARSGLHYAMPHYLLYWLQQEGKLRPFYRTFRAGVAADPTGAQTLREALAVADLDEFQAGWERWVLSLRRD